VFDKGLNPFTAFRTPFAFYYLLMVVGGGRFMHALADRFIF
jgi:hypothetical protein